MADLTFNQIVAETRKLSTAQKATLIQMLQVWVIGNPSREELLAEIAALRAVGAFEQVECLGNKYIDPAIDHLSDEELLSTIHEAATEWEKELDELFGADDKES